MNGRAMTALGTVLAGLALAPASAGQDPDRPGQAPGPAGRFALDLYAELREADFESSAARACEAVNAWADKQTQGKVKDLLRPELLAGQTRLVLTNAVYLKAAWASPFPKDRTGEGPFDTGGGRTVAVPFM